MKTRVLAAILFLLLGLPLVAETIVVTETTQGKTIRHTSTLTRIESEGLLWETSVSDQGTSRSGTTPEGSLRVFEWTSPDGKAVLTSDGTVLRVSGTHKGKELKGSLDLKGRIWTMNFDQPLKWYAKKGFTGSMPFLMVSPTDLAHPTGMILTKEAEETLLGRQVVRLKVGLEGALSLFWSAKVWAESSGTEVRYQGNKGPGTPDSLIALESITP